MLTGTPVHITNIRAGRAKSGLLRQHLTALQASATISDARISGAELRSNTFTFEPGTVRGGEHTFSIGSAGSTTLVLQTILLPLALAAEPSRIVLEGGTHNPAAPPFEFLAQAYLRQVNRMGPKIQVTLDRAGFYPAGGGRIVVDITPAPTLTGFELLNRGALRRRWAKATVSKLPDHIAEREVKVLRKSLSWPNEEFETAVIDNSPGPGNVVTIGIEFEHTTEVFTSFGEVRRAAEAVASAAVKPYKSFIKTAATAGEYLTDQLMLPLAIAGDGAFLSTGLSLHASTHLELIGKFLDVQATVEESDTPRQGVTVRFG
jgi:RNA 3'-terminal phosphate cyclase (ATP)